VIKVGAVNLFMSVNRKNRICVKIAADC